MSNQKYIVNGDDLKSIADTIRSKTGDTENLLFPDDFVNGIDSINGSEEGGTGDEDVLFYDDLMNNGDGGIYYACSAAELQAMTSLPENPDHSDYSTQGISIPMTSQGWNWTRADAKAQVAATGKIEIGQMYKPTDEKSHYVLYVPENDKRKKFTVMIEVTGGSVTYKLDNEAEQTASETFTITFATFGWHHLTISAGTGVTYKHQELSIGRNQICKYLLKEAYFSDKVSFADRGLYQYFNLEKITLAYGMESFDSTYVFYANNTLKRVTIPSGITTIGTALFFYCYNLKYISIPKSVTRFESSVFTDTYNIKRITIPINITELGIYMFNESGVKSIDISSTNLIEIRSFRNAQRLEEAHFEHTTATEIGSYAFYLCSSLRKVVLPSTITNIENQAFSETGVLEEIVLLSTTPPTLGGNILYNSADDITIVVPAGYGDTYKAASGWSDYASKIVEATT